MLGATIIVVAILTALIFILTIVAFSSMLKAEKKEIEAGNRDEEIKQELEKEKKKSSKIINWVSSIVGGLIIAGLLSLSAMAITYKASGQQFAINDAVGLVIVSDSMDGFYDDAYASEVLTWKEDAKEDQFEIGDILKFTVVADTEELVLYDVYGYSTKSGKTITHRYIGATEDGKLIFRGDNTGGRDSYVDRSQVVLHYENIKVPRFGYFVLFTQSGFGLYAFASVITVYAVAEVYVYKYNKLIKNRLSTCQILIVNDETKEEENTDEK